MTRTQLRARPREHYIYSGHSLLVTNLDGVVTGAGIEGFYFEETRLLSCFELTLGGRPLLPIAAGPAREDSFLGYLQVPEQSVYVELAHFVDAGMRTDVRIQNWAIREPAHVDLAIHLAADFADIRERETREGRRQQSAPVEAAWDVERQELVFRYGHPRLDRAVAVRVERADSPAV